MKADAEGFYAVYKYQATVPEGSGLLQICNLGKGAKKEGLQYELEAQSIVYPTLYLVGEIKEQNNPKEKDKNL